MKQGIEWQVCSRELAEELKKLGVPQVSLFWWVKGEMNYKYEGEWDIKEGDDYFIFSETLGRKPDDYDFRVDVGDIPDDTNEFLAWERRIKILEEIAKIDSMIRIFPLSKSRTQSTGSKKKAK